MVRRIAGLSVWLIGPLLGASVGFYYTLLPFGGSGSVIPLEPVSFAAATGYYFGGGPYFAEATQAFVWVGAFTGAFLVWAISIAISGGYGPYRLTRLWVAYGPLILLGLPLAFMCGETDTGFSIGRLVEVALRRDFQTGPEWVSVAFLSTSAWATIAQILWLWRKIKALLFAGLTLLIAMVVVAIAAYLQG